MAISRDLLSEVERNASWNPIVQVTVWIDHCTDEKSLQVTWILQPEVASDSDKPSRGCNIQGISTPKADFNDIEEVLRRCRLALTKGQQAYLSIAWE